MKTDSKNRIRPEEYARDVASRRAIAATAEFNNATPERIKLARARRSLEELRDARRIAEREVWE